MQRVRRWKWADIARDESKAVDLLLTEVVMPRMNGPELARLLRELRPELVAPFMTGLCRRRSSPPGGAGRSAQAHSEAAHSAQPIGPSP